MKNMFCSLVLLLIFYPSVACLNEYAIDAHGHKHILDRFSIRFRPFDKSEIFERLNYLEKKLTTKYSFENHSDYAVNLLKIGRTNEALDILKKLHLLHPDEYNVMANLGTAYELAGQNDSAIKYIQLGIATNPYSHYGSEWVHARILEIKLLQPDTAQIKNLRIFDLDTSNFDTIEKFTSHLQYQLEERMPFTPLGDALLAKILEEAGDYQVNHVSFSRGRLYYEMAKVYYPQWAPAMDIKIKRVDALIKKFKTKRHKRWEEYSLKPLRKHKPLNEPYVVQDFRTQ